MTHGASAGEVGKQGLCKAARHEWPLSKLLALRVKDP